MQHAEARRQRLPARRGPFCFLPSLPLPLLFPLLAPSALKFTQADKNVSNWFVTGQRTARAKAHTKDSKEKKVIRDAKVAAILKDLDGN
jgi:hypothetical protein